MLFCVLLSQNIAGSGWMWKPKATLCCHCSITIRHLWKHIVHSRLPVVSDSVKRKLRHHQTMFRKALVKTLNHRQWTNKQIKRWRCHIDLAWSHVDSVKWQRGLSELSESRTNVWKQTGSVNHCTPEWQPWGDPRKLHRQKWQQPHFRMAWKVLGN